MSIVRGEWANVYEDCEYLEYGGLLGKIQTQMYALRSWHNGWVRLELSYVILMFKIQFCLGASKSQVWGILIWAYLVIEIIHYLINYC